MMPRVLRFIDVMKNNGLATMIHCHYGCDRTGAALACYLVAREMMDADTAVLTIQRLNPDALWAVGYADAVSTFEEEFRAHPEVYNGTPQL
jgi:protein-tyrosine phosphatase